MDFEAELIRDFGHEKEDESGGDRTVDSSAGGDRTVDSSAGGDKRMRGAHGKTAYAIRVNVARMIQEEGIDCIGFLTLTIGNQKKTGFEQVFDAEEASRRFNSLRPFVLKNIFSRAVIVTERHKSGAIHFHLVGAVRGRVNIKKGFRWEGVKKRRNTNACQELRDIWEMMRGSLKEFGFGRAELTPIRTTGPQIASYLSKYVTKHLDARRPEDKGKRLVRYLGWDKDQLKAAEFGWASRPARQWRAKAKQAAALIGCFSPEDCAEKFGPKWAWILTESWGRICGHECGWELNLSEGRREVLWEVLMKWADLRKVSLRPRLIDGDTVHDCKEFFSRGLWWGEGGWMGGHRIELFREKTRVNGSRCHTLTPSAPPSKCGKSPPCAISI